MSRECRHARRGIVTNQPDGYDPHRAHASTQCCERPECIREAKRRVAGHTNETAYFIPDADRSVRR